MNPKLKQSAIVSFSTALRTLRVLLVVAVPVCHAIAFGAENNRQASDEDIEEVIEEVIVTGTWLPNTLDDKAIPVSRLTKNTCPRRHPSLLDLIRYMTSVKA